MPSKTTTKKTTAKKAAPKKESAGLSMQDVWATMEFVVNKIAGETLAKRISTTAQKCWEGEEELQTVFWLYGFLGGIGVSILATSIQMLFGPFGMIVSFIIVVPYMIWALYSIWQCAPNIKSEEIMSVKREYITMVARGVALIAALKFFLTL